MGGGGVTKTSGFQTTSQGPTGAKTEGQVGKVTVTKCGGGGKAPGGWGVCPPSPRESSLKIYIEV